MKQIRIFINTYINRAFRNECESLHWKNIDLVKGTLSFINPYNNVYYKIYMGNFLWHLMKKRRMQNKGEWVFPSVKSESGHIINISKFRKKLMSNVIFLYFSRST